ncbi:uncharacterized protein I303_106254 [Kwoniella dejecticola CBS 10117]|uniref:F-box domain-containing protein n=1 Tax=Kwoniella dejecticola CBS 10117 TaxID=1296121 RepID=A0A1A6A1Q2_9TREE|nr:uncharacterized protein I303_06273 [Kwoniella dejecticola CBS 10117]OBR83986.1 hypothetical protein I303_06273 [Kwoniella dejecticola CBS 10117]
MAVLDDDVLEAILLRLGVRDLLICSRVSRQFNNVIASSTMIQLKLYTHLLRPPASTASCNESPRTLHERDGSQNPGDELRRLIEREKTLIVLRPKHRTIHIPADQGIIASGNRYIGTAYSDFRAMMLNDSRPPGKASNGLWPVVIIWDLENPISPFSSKREGQVSVEGKVESQQIYVPFQPDLNAIAVCLEHDLLAVMEEKGFSLNTNRSGRRSNTVHLFHLFSEDGVAIPRKIEQIKVEFIPEWSNIPASLSLEPGDILRMTRERQHILLDCPTGSVIGVLQLPYNVVSPTIMMPDPRTIIANIYWPIAPGQAQGEKRYPPIQRYIAVYEVNNLPDKPERKVSSQTFITQPTLLLSLPSTEIDVPPDIGHRLRPRREGKLPGDDTLIGMTWITDTTGMEYFHLRSDIAIDNVKDDGIRRAALCIRMTSKSLRSLIRKCEVQAEQREIEIEESILWQGVNGMDLNANKHERIRRMMPHVRILEPRDWLVHATVFIETEMYIASIVQSYANKVIGADILRSSQREREEGSEVGQVHLHIRLQDYNPLDEELLGYSLGGLGRKKLVPIGTKDMSQNTNRKNGHESARVPGSYVERVERSSTGKTTVRTRNATFPAAGEEVEQVLFNGSLLAVQYSSGTQIDVFNFDNDS